jgi:phage-related protein
MWSGIVSAISSGVSNAYNAVVGVKDRIVGFFSGAGSWLLDAGRSIISGLVSGIQNMIGAVTGAVSSVVSAARNLLPFSPAKEGPFSGRGWTLYSGEALVKGLAQGIAAEEDNLLRTISGVVATANDAMSLEGSMTGIKVPTARVAGSTAASEGPTINNYDVSVTVPMDDLAQLRTFEDFMSMLRVRTRMGVSVGNG